MVDEVPLTLIVEAANMAYGHISRVEFQNLTSGVTYTKTDSGWDSNGQPHASVGDNVQVKCWATNISTQGQMLLKALEGGSQLAFGLKNTPQNDSVYIEFPLVNVQANRNLVFRVDP